MQDLLDLIPTQTSVQISRKREMASLAEIAGYWATAEETAIVFPELASHWIGWGEPFCFACGWLAPVKDGPDAWSEKSLPSWLDRAHLIDHWLGGSGEPPNVVPLCVLCHLKMTKAFDDRAAAIAWVRDKESSVPYPQVWQAFTDASVRGGSRPQKSRVARIQRMRGDYLEMLLTTREAISGASIWDFHSPNAAPDQPRRASPERMTCADGVQLRSVSAPSRTEKQRKAETRRRMKRDRY